MATEVQESFALMEEMGVFSYILPFMLIFVIIYAILEKTEILVDKDSKSRRAINATTSVTIALFSLYFANLYGVGSFLAHFLTRGSLILVMVVMALAMTTFIFKTINHNKLVSEKHIDRARAAIFFFVTGAMINSLSGAPQYKAIIFGSEAADVSGMSMILFLLAFFVWWVK